MSNINFDPISFGGEINVEIHTLQTTPTNVYYKNDLHNSIFSDTNYISLNQSPSNILSSVRNSIKGVAQWIVLTDAPQYTSNYSTYELKSLDILTKISELPYRNVILQTTEYESSKSF